MNPEDLSGLIRPATGAELRRLAALVPADHAIVEIGSFRGQSSAYLAAGARDGLGAHVYAVDPWDLAGNVSGKHGCTAPEIREDFERQLRACRLWSRVTPMRAFSTDAAKAWSGPKVGLLFIDGDHTERAVRADVKAWTPHLADGAVICFDDYDTRPNPGVKIVADEMGCEVVAGHLAVVRSVGAPDGIL